MLVRFLSRDNNGYYGLNIVELQRVPAALDTAALAEHVYEIELLPRRLRKFPKKC